MQTASEVAQQQKQAVDVILDVLSRHDPEARGRIEVLFSRGAQRWTIRGGVVGPQDELLTILCEAVATLGKRVDELEAARAPRPRGRPPKTQQEAS